jgi:putative transposase
MSYLTEKVKLHFNKETEAKLRLLSNDCKNVWNNVKDQADGYYKAIGCSLFILGLQKTIKNDNNHLYSKTIQMVIINYNTALKVFFATHKLWKSGKLLERPRHPKKKNDDSFFSIPYNQSGFNVKQNLIKLSTKDLGFLNLYCKINPITFSNIEKVNNIIIKQDKISNEYYACITYTPKISKRLFKGTESKTIVFDPGSKTLLTGFDGENFLKFSSNELKNSNKYYDNQLDKIKSKQSKTQRDSKRNKKLQLAKEKLYNKRNKRQSQILHSFANYICERYDNVIIGDWNKASTISEYTKINRVIQNQLNLGEFKRIISYKVGNIFDIIDEKYSTQTCSNCGKRHKLSLSDRVYKCEHCSLSLDRDINSSINLYCKHTNNADVILPWNKLSSKEESLFQCNLISYSFGRKNKIINKSSNFIIGNPSL